jgi:hypothetical protein
MTKKKKKSKIFTILLIIVFLFSNSNIEQNNVIEKETIPKMSSVVAGTLELNAIRFTHIKGTEDCKTRITFNAIDIQDAYDGETLRMSIMSSFPSGVVRRIDTGLSEDNTIMFSEFTYNVVNDGGYGQSFECYSSNEYLTSYSSLAYVYDDNSTSGNTNKEIYYTQTQGTSHSNYELFDLRWDLYPIISIDSDFYNLNNIRIEVYDRVIASWTEYDPNNIILTHPQYKIRIYDKQTSDLIFEDTSYQYFKFYREVSIDSIKLINNYEEPILFKLTGTSSDNIQVNPFSSTILLNDGYTAYTVEDLYGNELNPGGSITTGDNITYTPLYGDGVYLTYIDQNEITLDFESFETEIDFGDGYIPVLNQLFNAERNLTIDISVYDLSSNLLTNDSLFISPGLNYKNITIPVVYIENNANEQITAYLFNESSEPTDFYTYSYLDSDYESYENSSYIENFDSNSFQDTTISFENNSNNCPSLSIAYENQIGIGENNTFNIFPIKTVNDISIVKIWNNITLVNETLTESSGYYSKTFNSSYSHYYSVEIYIEDTSGYYNIMKIDNIFVLKNSIRINLENLQNKYIQYTSLNVSASLYEFDGSLISGSVNFTLKYPNGTIIKEDETPNLEYNFGYSCGYYTLIVEYFGDLDNLLCNVETIFEVITPPGISYQPIYFNEDPIFNITISPYSSEFHNMTSFSNELLYIMYFDIYNNELQDEVFNFSTTNTLDYTPEMLKQCRIILTDQFSNLLEFENYHVYINSESILSNLFYRSVDSTLNITIYDLFGNLLYENDYIVEREDNFIDLTIDQFSLKILNQLEDSTILNITNDINPLEFVLSEYIAINELLSLYVKDGNYSIYFIDDSGDEHTLSLNINQSRLIVLNTTYHEVHFAFFDISGLGLDPDTARFYINDNRRDIGKNWIQGDNCSIKVLDYFNETLYSESISLVGLTEYNIYLPVYTMLINNNYSTSMEISIKRIGNGIEFKQIIPGQYGIDIRLLANVEYGIKMYYTNGSFAESKTVLLNENYEKISFGDYEEIINAIPDLVQTETNDWIIAVSIIFLIAFIAVIIVILLIRKFNTRTKYEIVNIPSKTFMG